MNHYPTTHTHLSGDRVADVRRNTIGNYRTQPHEHGEYMFLLPRSGQLIVNVESNPAPLRVAPRSFVVVPPRRLHDTRGYKTSQEHIAIYVASEFVDFCERKANKTLSCEIISIWSVPLPLLNVVRLAAGAAAAATDELNDFRADLMARVVATTCIQAGLKPTQSSLKSADLRRKVVSEIQAFLDCTLDQSVTIDRVAQEFNLSRRTLTRIFRDITGESIVEYQSRRRVHHASVLLREPGTTVVAAATAVGLDSPSYLARLFRKYGQPFPRTLKT